MLIDYFIDWYQCIYYFNGGFKLVDIYYLSAIFGVCGTLGLFGYQFYFQKQQAILNKSQIEINEKQIKLLEAETERQRADDYAINWSVDFKLMATEIGKYYANNENEYYEECFDFFWTCSLKDAASIMMDKNTNEYIELSKKCYYNIVQKLSLMFNKKYFSLYLYKSVIPLHKTIIQQVMSNVLYYNTDLNDITFNMILIKMGHIDFLENIEEILNAIKNFNNGLLSFSQANKNRIYTTLKNNDNIRNLMKILSYIIEDKDLFDYDKIIACYEKLSEADRDLIKEKCNNILTIINEDSGNIIQSNIWAIYRC